MTSPCPRCGDVLAELNRELDERKKGNYGFE